MPIPGDISRFRPNYAAFFKLVGNVPYAGRSREALDIRERARMTSDTLKAVHIRETVFPLLASTEAFWEYIDFPDLPFPGLDRAYGFEELPLADAFSAVWARLQVIAANPVCSLQTVLTADSLPELRTIDRTIRALLFELADLTDRRIEILRREIYGYRWNECFLESCMVRLDTLIGSHDVHEDHKRSAKRCLSMSYESTVDTESRIREANNIIRCAFDDLSLSRYYQKRAVYRIRAAVFLDFRDAELRIGEKYPTRHIVSKCLQDARALFRVADDQLLNDDVILEASALAFLKVREYLIEAYEILAVL